MNITSFSFICFYVFVILIYYIIPRKCQWVILLASSILFLMAQGKPFLLCYPIFSVLVCYFGTRWIESARSDKKRRAAMLLTVIANLLILFILKYISFPISTINGALSIWQNPFRLKMPEFMIPIGISFYTFSMIGYVLDVYRNICKRQNNLLKLAAFGLYFPLLTSGPIVNYREYGAQFYEKHEFHYKKITRGLQRVVWGFFKKLVIAERMGKIVDTVYNNPSEYMGGYIWIATIAFAFQLYTDFSGCMDIVLGISESFGISLPENFTTPFFSRTISEYWRKWHITLGVWMKEYLFYPILRSKCFTSLGKHYKEKFGKKRGKQFTTFLAMLILWFTVGLWHGGAWKYIIGSGLLHWFYIVFGELTASLAQRIMKKMSINPNGRAVNAIRTLRTFYLVCIGFVFFRAADVPTALQMLINGLKWQNLDNIFNLGLEPIEFIVAIVSLTILLVVSILQQKKSIRDRVAEKSCWIRWIIWYSLLFYVILLGCYGPGYSAAEFIYQGF